jgi:hypothetical protein
VDSEPHSTQLYNLYGWAGQRRVASDRVWRIALLTLSELRIGALLDCVRQEPEEVDNPATEELEEGRQRV